MNVLLLLFFLGEGEKLDELGQCRPVAGASTFCIPDGIRVYPA